MATTHDELNGIENVAYQISSEENIKTTPKLDNEQHQIDSENNLNINNTNQSNENPETKVSFLKRLNITVEPIFLIFFFCSSLSDASSTNIILSSTCEVIYNLPKKNCTGELTREINELVQPYSSRVLMTTSVIEAIFPSILSFFIGSWIDVSKRRKPFLILPIIGIAIDYVIWLIFLYIRVHPMLFILTSLPHSLAGGFVSIYTCGFSYLSDVTSESNRAFRMTICMMSLAIGVLCGYLASIEIYKAFNTINFYFVTYGLSLFAAISLLLYTVFILPETTTPTEKSDLENNQSFSSFFNISHIKQSVNVLLKKRPSNGRLVLLILLTVLVIDLIVFQGETNIKYLSLKASFSWSALDFNIFSAVFSATTCVTGIAGVWILNKVLRLSEKYMICLVVILALVSTIFQSLSTSTTEYYCAVLLNALNVIISPLIKSEVSHLVSHDDVGKIFAFTSTIEALTPFVASPLYTEVYNALLLYRPLYFYFLSTILWLVTLTLVVISITLMRRMDLKKEPVSAVIIH